MIDHCPWCGEKLPTSLRDEFFDRLEELGLEPNDLDVPLDLRSDAWWRIRPDVPPRLLMWNNREPPGWVTFLARFSMPGLLIWPIVLVAVGLLLLVAVLR